MVKGNTRPSSFFVVPASSRTSPVSKSTRRHSKGSTSLGGVRVLGAVMKAPAFQGEQEWRLITFEFKDGLPDDNPLETGFRAVGQRLVSYGVAAYPKGVPLSDVVLEPVTNPERHEPRQFVAPLE